jgi:undecaprenyl pyrophosphate synthase
MEPQHLPIVTDGNGRRAERNQPRAEAHRARIQAFRK